jgi:hypothetical protein
MRLWMALAALLPACGFGSSASTDGGHDAPPDAQQCFGSFVRVCFASAAAIPVAPKMLDNIDIDTDATDANSQCNQDNDQAVHYCVVAGAGLTVMTGKVVKAHGSKPLVLLSMTTIDVLGDVDVASRVGPAARRGAGANPAAPACSFATAPVPAQLGGGAYGGSFGSKGGSGSPASPAGTSVIGLPGSASPMFPVPLRGGCRGGDAVLVGTTSDGKGGDGGGAVAFAAIDQIHVSNAKINASGSGGHGGPSGLGNSGGGGGGSGGMIYFDSPKDLVFDGSNRIWANGGGGAQGGSMTTKGDDGNESSGPMAVAGVTNGPTAAGNNGGTGSLGDGAGGDGVSDAAAGGGGGAGGGAGVIHAPGLSGAAFISPSSTSETPSA